VTKKLQFFCGVSGAIQKKLANRLATAMLLIIGILSGVLSVMIALDVWVPSLEVKIPTENIGIYPYIKEKDSGYAVYTLLEYKNPNYPNLFIQYPTDSTKNSRASTLVLYENGLKLGPPHSQHKDIIDKGKGRFVHWGKVLHFSASDNSDPRTNGRTYGALIKARYTDFLFFSCIVLLIASLFFLHSIHAKKIPNFLTELDKRVNFNNSKFGILFHQMRENIRLGNSSKLVIVLTPILITLIAILIDSSRSLNWQSELSPDAQNYKLISDAMQNPWDTVPRESAFIWIIKLFLFIFNNSDTGIRIAGLCMYYLTSCFVFLIGRNILNSIWVGAASQFVFLQNDFLFNIGFSGLRDSYFLLSIAGLLFAMFSGDRYLKRNWRLFWLCLFFSIAVGTRFSTVGPTILILIMSCFLAKRPLRFIWAPILAGMIVIGPFIAISHEKTGDAFYANNVHASWWRNFEFVVLKKTGCRGCPTLEQVKESTYAGEPVTVQEYMFSLHFADELVLETISGMWSIFSPVGDYKKIIANSDTEYIFYFLGILLVFLRGLWIVPICFVLWVNFLAYTVHIGMPVRLFSFVGVFQSVMTGWGVVWLLSTFYLSFISRRLTFRKFPIDGTNNLK